MARTRLPKDRSQRPCDARDLFGDIATLLEEDGCSWSAEELASWLHVTPADLAPHLSQMVVTGLVESEEDEGVPRYEWIGAPL